MRELNPIELNAVSGGFLHNLGTALNVASTIATHSATRYIVGNAGGNMALYAINGHLSGNGTTGAGYAGAAIGGLVGGATKNVVISGVGGQMTAAAEGVFNGKGALAHYFAQYQQNMEAAMAAAGV